jgi:hypothetical protein
MNNNIDFLNNIDFYNHDGVNLPMINDFMRNQFYESIFKQHVAEKNCIDIGFGTGLLSILAIKHGAQEITAYESDSSRFCLGQTIIKQLCLENQINLIHGRYDYSVGVGHKNITTIFSEIVNGNIWNEGLFNSLPRSQGINFLPGQYFVEIYACVIPDSFAQGLLLPSVDNRGFSPGIDLDLKFVNCVNQLGFPEYKEIPLNLTKNKITIIGSNVESVWGWIPYMRVVEQTGTLVASYKIDAETNTNTVTDSNGTVTTAIDFSSAAVELTVDTGSWKNQSVVLVPRAGMQHGKHRLFLDTGHWGPTQYPAVLQHLSGSIKISQDFYSGLINYDLC